MCHSNTSRHHEVSTPATPHKHSPRMDHLQTACPHPCVWKPSGYLEKEKTVPTVPCCASLLLSRKTEGNMDLRLDKTLQYARLHSTLEPELSEDYLVTFSKPFATWCSRSQGPETEAHSCPESWVLLLALPSAAHRSPPPGIIFSSDP